MVFCWIFCQGWSTSRALLIWAPVDTPKPAQDSATGRAWCCQALSLALRTRPVSTEQNDAAIEEKLLSLGLREVPPITSASCDARVEKSRPRGLPPVCQCLSQFDGMDEFRALVNEVTGWPQNVRRLLAQVRCSARLASRRLFTESSQCRFVTDCVVRPHALTATAQSVYVYASRRVKESLCRSQVPIVGQAIPFVGVTFQFTHKKTRIAA